MTGGGTRRGRGGMQRKTLSMESIRASLWFWPALAVIASLALALLLLRVRGERGSGWAEAAWPGDASAALALLQSVATATMAATTLTFSLTVVALQLSSQQFSPRLLRQFARDPFTQALLALLVSTFVVSVTGLRGIREGEPLPALLLALVSLLAVACIVGLLAFTGHLVRSLRVETMMVGVHRETVSTIQETYPEIDASVREDEESIRGTTEGRLVTAVRSGFLRVIEVEPLVAAASELGVRCELLVRPGDHLIAGTPVALLWADDGSPAPLSDELQDALGRSLEIGYERTVEQDVAFGFRQLTDIAVKAISPGINDPATATHAIGYCADLLARLQGRRLGSQVHEDEAGRARVLLPDRDLRYYLDVVCVPLRHYGQADVTVLSALLRMLRDVATNCREQEQRHEIRRQVELVEGEATKERLGADAERVRAVAEQVRKVLAGDLQGGFLDRAGETRSV